jgi:hypothetical protein
MLLTTKLSRSIFNLTTKRSQREEIKMKKWDQLENVKGLYKATQQEFDKAVSNIYSDSKRLNGLLKVNNPIYAELVHDLKRDIAHNEAVRDELEVRLSNVAKMITTLKEEVGYNSEYIY